MNNKLEEFYQSWSDKPENVIKYYDEAAVRKVDEIFKGMPEIKELPIRSMLDFGCGYGKVLQNCVDKLALTNAYGFDFSEQSIDYANAKFATDGLEYYRLQTLNIDENVRYIQSVISGGRVDCILLIDLLEHVPDCERLILKLSELTDYFVIKLPIEENVIDNYFLKKIYPSTKHYNGHLREFTVNSVHYFIRKLGLTPIAEGVNIYSFKDSYPPQTAKTGLLRSVMRNLLKGVRIVLAQILPPKIYLRLIGPGSYCCVATFNKDHILNP